MPINRTQTLYISSKHRTEGTASHYYIPLPQPLIDASSQIERIKISLIDFSCYYTWFLINDGFNTIYFTNLSNNVTTVVTLPVGTYRFQLLAQTIESLFAGCRCQWDEPSNKLVFTFATPYRMSFDGIYKTLGFNHLATPEGTQIVSTNPMEAMATTHLYITMPNVSAVAESVNLDNLNGEVRVSNILSRIPINASPFQLITYSNQTPDDNGIDTTEGTLSRLEILIIDNDGEELTYIPDHELAIRLQIYTIEDEAQKDMYEDIKAIRDTVKDIFLQKALKNNNIGTWNNRMSYPYPRY
jgi:hypothetical protein